MYKEILLKVLMTDTADEFFEKVVFGPYAVTIDVGTGDLVYLNMDYVVDPLDQIDAE